MGRPYSQDLRERIVAAVEAGISRRAAARQFAVSVSCVIKLVQRFRRMGTVAAGRWGVRSALYWQITKRWFATWLRHVLTSPLTSCSKRWRSEAFVSGVRQLDVFSLRAS